MKIAIINGPNLNRLTSREEKFYGKEDFSSIFGWLQGLFPQESLEYFQSNHEGEIIDQIQKLADEKVKGLVLNAGAYTHYSIAIRDALVNLPFPVIEVHLSNIDARESFRQVSVISAVATGSISGLGKHSYRLAIEYLCDKGATKIGF